MCKYICIYVCSKMDRCKYVYMYIHMHTYIYIIVGYRFQRRHSKSYDYCLETATTFRSLLHLCGTNMDLGNTVLYKILRKHSLVLRTIGLSKFRYRCVSFLCSFCMRNLSKLIGGNNRVFKSLSMNNLK